MTDGSEIAVVGGGCFWCVEAVFQRVRGVLDVRPGYAGGARPNPTYEQISSGATGHAEVVEIRFDPRILAYSDLLYIFFGTHDPTTLNRQGADVGTQYRSAIFPQTSEQELTARQVIDELQSSGAYPSPIVTTIETGKPFYPAESEHLEYYRRNPAQPYCMFVIRPKIEKLEQLFTQFLNP